MHANARGSRRRSGTSRSRGGRVFPPFGAKYWLFRRAQQQRNTPERLGQRGGEAPILHVRKRCAEDVEPVERDEAGVVGKLLDLAGAADDVDRLAAGGAEEEAEDLADDEHVATIGLGGDRARVREIEL